MYKIGRPKAFMLVAAAVVIHMTVLSRAQIFNLRPDLIFSLVIFFGLFASPRVALESAALSGLLEDTLSSGRFGLNIILLPLVAFVISRVAPHFYRESRFAQGLLTAVSYMLSAAAYYLFVFIGSMGSGLEKDCLGHFLNFFAFTAVPDGLYTSLVSIIIFPRLMDYFGVSDRVLL